VDDNAVMSATDTLASQLREIFGNRVKMIAEFGAHAQVCGIVDTVTIEDLDKCAALFAKDRPAPLLMLVDELSRALDAFPLEFNEIISTRRLIAGTDLLAALTVPVEDLRRACEAQARGHLVHLREGYIEAAGKAKSVTQLVSASDVPFRALVSNIARLDGTSGEQLQIQLGLATTDFPAALGSAERLVEYVDRWRKA
jgi:hypothetical protein